MNPNGAPQGGPPQGGPPPGSGGPPQGGPPGGPPKGGPPARTAAQQLVDTIFEAAFPLLYAFEPDGMLDSEKNLRVLWVRALLASAGQLQDDVALELLPAASRWLVAPPLARTVWSPVLPKLEWIEQRTSFIDAAVDAFLAGAGEGAQVVLVGAGYDTRALRYRASGATFFEVDLPMVISVKQKLAAGFLAAAAGGGGAFRAADAARRSLGCDLNAAAGDVFAQLQSQCGLVPDAPTLVVVEAVLFYLSPPAKTKLLEETAALLAAGPPASGLVLTDNLAPFVRGPMRPAAEGYLQPLGLALDEHSTLWGGAIQFVRARAAPSE